MNQGRFKDVTIKEFKEEQKAGQAFLTPTQGEHSI